MDIDLLYERLAEAHPDSSGFLVYRNPFELLIAVGLSAQTTDDQVNRVTPKLFGRFSTPKALGSAPVHEVEEIVFTTGFYRQKARHAVEAARRIDEHFNGEVPSTMEELTSLPGIGRKSASVILGAIYGKPAIIVDTHFSRVVRRLELTRAKDPYRIERDLSALLPEERQYRFSMLVNRHGREYCHARTPDCTTCPVADLCPSRIG